MRQHNPFERMLTIILAGVAAAATIAAIVSALI
jgi:hypothetical protein